VDQVHASENTMPLTQRILGKAHISTNRVNTYCNAFLFLHLHFLQSDKYLQTIV